MPPGATWFRLLFILRRAVLPFLAFVLPLGVYLVGGHYCGSGDTEPAELLPIALLRDGSFSFSRFVKASEPLPYWYRNVHGRVVSTYPILPGLLNVPAYAVADLFGVDLYARRDRLSMISAATISALSVLFLFLALERVCSTRGRAFIFAMVYAFATCVWSVTSRGMWQHGPSLLLLTISLWLLERGEPWAASWSGFFLALAVLNRPSNVLLAAPLAASVLWSRRPAALRFLGLGLVAVALRSLYAWAYWGSPFSLAQANPSPQAANFGGNPFVGLAGLLVSPSRGLLVFSPVFLFSLLAVPAVLRRRREDPIPFCLAVGALALLLLTSKWTIWWGGHSFGYRLLIETLPALTVLLAIAWEERIQRRLLPRALFGLSLAWSVFVSFLGARIYPSGFNQRLDENPAVLWSVRDGEIALSAKKAFGIGP